MKGTMTYLALISLVSAVSCSQDYAQAVHSQPAAAHNEPTLRGSTAPSAPVQLTYQVPAVIVANQQTAIDVEIGTRLDHGAMLVEIAGHEGVTLLCDTQYRFDLGAISTRPIPLHLKVLPADQAERFLAVLITVDTEMGPMARSFRIDLQAASVAPASANKPLIQQ